MRKGGYIIVHVKEITTGTVTDTEDIKQLDKMFKGNKPVLLYYDKLTVSMQGNTRELLNGCLLCNVSGTYSGYNVVIGNFAIMMGGATIRIQKDLSTEEISIQVN